MGEETAGRAVVRIIEAVFTNGVLKPVEALGLREYQRVRLVIQDVGDSLHADRAEALRRLRAGIAGIRFSSSGPLPPRDNLHDRR
jgi:predicted DNA-binding antitoxin AbrB/MazE fold protein